MEQEFLDLLCVGILWRAGSNPEAWPSPPAFCVGGFGVRPFKQVPCCSWGGHWSGDPALRTADLEDGRPNPSVSHLRVLGWTQAVLSIV